MKDQEWLIIIAAIVVLELLLKQYFLMVLSNGNVWLMKPYISLSPAYNSGIAFSFPLPQWVLLFLPPSIVTLLFFYQKSPEVKKSVLSSLLLAILSAGALSNWIDRFRFGAVFDYISIGHYPIFNVPDILITGAVLGLIIQLFFESQKKTNELAQ